MKNLIFRTNENYATLILRVVLGTIIIIHGIDKLGEGFQPFMSYFTDILNMPAVLGWLTIFIETVGCLMLILGFATRINAVLLFGLFSGMIIFVHWGDGFLMNWFGQLEAGKEGFEYHLLVLAMSAALFIMGSGALSIDKYLTKA
ncbi:MAG: DoxX family protein [Bacteroidota bacterium]